MENKIVIHYRKRKLYNTEKTACGIHLFAEFEDGRNILIVRHHFVDILATTQKGKVTCGNCKRTRYFEYELGDKNG